MPPHHGWMAALEERQRAARHRRPEPSRKGWYRSMAGKKVPFVNFGESGDGKDVATQDPHTEDLIRDIDAMLEDDRYTRQAPFLEQVKETIERTGTSTIGQRDAIDNIRERVEGDGGPRWRRS